MMVGVGSLNDSISLPAPLEVSLSKDREDENKNAQIPPALESWIVDVIVPVLVKRYLAELKEHDEPTASSAGNDRETRPVGVLKPNC
jgi:hypothetical protein